MQPRDPYRGLAPFYDALTSAFLERIRGDICRLAESGGARSALDLCCGTGRQCILFHRAGLRAAGVDLSPSMLAAARARSPAAVAYLRADAASLPLASGSFDAAVVSLALHENGPREQAHILQEARRVLRPRGLLLCLDYDPPSGLAGRVARTGFFLAERAMGGSHFANYKTFTRRGELTGLLARAGLSSLHCRRYFAGNLSLILART